ncbi:MAG: hypothetical protein LBB41_06650 [Prevotellaceae bacterium]|nr:hypothetical protein [Prevotellaceae bacterium]
MNRGSYCVYKYDDRTRQSASKIDDFPNYSDARALAYRLNGEWMDEQEQEIRY